MADKSDQSGLDTTRLLMAAVGRGGPAVESVEISTEAIDAADPTRPSTGSKIGRYVLGPSLGLGGMGSVFKAHDTLLDIAVALKLPRLDVDSQRPQQASFLTEARTLARLSHPHLCRIFDYGDIGGRPFISMAFGR